MRKSVRKSIIITIIILFVLYCVAVNLLINIALIPRFMEEFDSFEDITEYSLNLQVHTDDITENSKKAWEETHEWLDVVNSETLEGQTSEGYNNHL